jgi:signal transduction histidine kinase
MKNTQALQNNHTSTGLTPYAPIILIKKIGAFFTAILPFAPKKQTLMLSQELRYKQEEIARLKWELLKKNELVKNISFHQSHTVRRPLANILGIIELMNTSKNELAEADMQELISLLKISADALDKAIKHNSAAGNV